MHALIIEDEALTAIVIEEVLRDCGFTSFDVASSEEGAIEAAMGHCPDLITSDVQLSPGCGISTVLTICNAEPVPVIFITGNMADAQLRVPQYAVLNKPFSDVALIAAVTAAMRGLINVAAKSD